MGPISAFITADLNHAAVTDAASAKPSATRSVFSTLTALLATARKTSNDRNLRKELASMDDALLRDIGVADDEIYLIRAGKAFTPRAWVGVA